MARDVLASLSADDPDRERRAGELARLERSAAEKVVVAEARGQYEARQAGT